MVRKAVGESAKHWVLRNYQRNASKRGVDWGLTEAEFDALTKAPCHYCGCQPASVYQRKDYNGAFVL